MTVKVWINDKWPLNLPDHREHAVDWRIWECERLMSMSQHIHSGHVVYDVGAEQGDLPALWATWGAEVVLIEPVPFVWPNMRACFTENNLPDPLATVVGFAGDTDRDWQISRGWPNEAYGPMTDVEGFSNLFERPDIPVVTLNTVARFSKPPTHITIDVEGAEFNVLAGAAAEVLTKHRPVVWVSIHPTVLQEWYGHTVDDILSLMAVHGYRHELLAVDHEEHHMFTPEER